MKTKIALVSILLLALTGFFSHSTIAQDQSNCVGCHTNESILKALCRVPALSPGKGEG